MASINSNDIEKKIDTILNNSNVYNFGFVTKINDFVIESTLLEDVFYFEKVFIGDDSNIGYVDKIENDRIVILVVKNTKSINIGDKIILSGDVLKGKYSYDSIGRIIDLFGNDMFLNKELPNTFSLDIETPNIPIVDRGTVNRSLLTGIATIDLMFPIGRGQRQLIVGDKKTGKTQILLDTIYNQKDKNVLCIYVAVGKTMKEIKRVYKSLINKGCQNYTLILCALNDEPQPLIKLIPYFSSSIAEQYMLQGKDVLICVDDLKKHADVCRQIALLSGKNTGRDIYPSDIFYSHSRFLEKGCQHINGGSITILPIVETKGGDISDYITTNIISITDGQIVLSSDLYNKGFKPAINAGLSVSRLGGAVQSDLMKGLGSRLRRELLSFLEVADTYQLVKEESLTPELRFKMKKGRMVQNALKQYKFSCLTEESMYETFSKLISMTIDDENNENSSEKEQVTDSNKISEVPNEDNNSLENEIITDIIIDKADNTVIDEKEVNNDIILDKEDIEIRSDADNESSDEQVQNTNQQLDENVLIGDSQVDNDISEVVNNVDDVPVIENTTPFVQNSEYNDLINTNNLDNIPIINSVMPFEQNVSNNNFNTSISSNEVKNLDDVPVIENTTPFVQNSEYNDLINTNNLDNIPIINSVMPFEQNVSNNNFNTSISSNEVKNLDDDGII